MLDIKKYEAMVKLDLPPDEREWVSVRAAELLESFRALDNVDVSGIEPLVTVLELRNAMREDVAVKLMSRDELLSNAPEQHDGCFEVPKTVE